MVYTYIEAFRSPPLGQIHIGARAFQFPKLMATFL